jgi:hypothetical protein
MTGVQSQTLLKCDVSCAMLITPDAAASSSVDWARREVQLDVVPSHGLAEQSLSDISKALLVVRMRLCIVSKRTALNRRCAPHQVFPST